LIQIVPSSPLAKKTKQQSGFTIPSNDSGI